MSGIIEKPISFREYYKSMHSTYIQKKEEAEVVLEDSKQNLSELYETICKDFDANKKEYPINLDEYTEFRNNRYEDGKFLRVAKGVLLNRKGNYELIGRNFDIYRLAKLQKDIDKIEKDIEFYNVIIDIKLNQYNSILKQFYTEVQKRLILDGCGYTFEGKLGWICINRCKVVNQRLHIDYQATKRRKAQLEAENKKIYNKEEAEWCAKNGIEYKAEDVRVFQKLEYMYEIPLLGCKIADGSNIKFQTSDYRGHSIRGKRNADLLVESNGDTNKICDYDVDIRTKLYVCLEADKLLYSKFIRNENQEPSVAKSSNR